MKRKFKIRYHLGRGENYMKWRVEDVTTKTVDFYDTDGFSMLAVGVKLHNQPATADKIHNGANKTVCAWIMASKVEFKPSRQPKGIQVSYNPRVSPNWMDQEGNNVDKTQHRFAYINNKKIIVE